MKKNLLKSFLFIFLILMLVFPLSTFASGDFCASNPTDPGCVGAQPCAALNGIGKMICQVHQILNSIIPVLVALGVVYFVWNVVQYVIGDGEEAKKKGRDSMIYGIIGLAVIIGLWGLVNIVVTTFGVDGVNAPGLNTVAANASCTIGTDVKGFLNYMTCLINSSVIPLIFALAVVMFVWGAVKFFIINADEEAKRAEGKQFMIWGIVALAVMLSVWGLVNILSSTFGITGGAWLPQVSRPAP